MAPLKFDRRSFLKATAGTLVATGAATRGALAAEKPIIGIVYVGPRDDFGWNQAHAVAAKALKGVPGVTVVEDENVPETDACAKTMESMINLDGANIILGTSFGYFDPFMIDLSKKYATRRPYGRPNCR
jgi:simple sugar transport system substrate-binding protein